METKKTISDSSKKLYIRCLEKMKKMNIDISNITDINIIKTKLKEIELSDATIKTYLSALLWHSRENNVNVEQQAKMTKIIKEICHNYNQEAGKGNLSEKEKEKFIKWETVVKIYNSLKDLYNKDINNKKIREHYIMLSLYVLMPPRRILDYVNLYIDNKQQIDISEVIKFGDIDYVKKMDENLEQNIPTDIKNYYVRKNEIGYFIFNNYKTKDSYASQCLELNPELDKILVDFIKISKLKHNNKIIDISHENFIFRLKKIFEAYINKSISASTLRHIFITYSTDNHIIKIHNNKVHLALQMGHSVLTQSKYAKHIDDIILDENLNEDAADKLLAKPGRKRIYATEEEKKEADNKNRRKKYHDKKLNLIKVE